jgi:hypothetical protein
MQPQLESSAGGPSTLGSLRIKMRLGRVALLLGQSGLNRSQIPSPPGWPEGDLGKKAECSLTTGLRKSPPRSDPAHHYAAVTLASSR